MRSDWEGLAAWVARDILPHERDVRVWLARRFVDGSEVEDVVQECYCRLAQLRDVTCIDNARAYLFTLARNIAREQRRRASVVRFESLSEAGGAIEDDAPGPQRIVEGRLELGRLQNAIDSLSDRARRIFIMRKVEGLSQKQIAATLGISETIVENDSSRALRAVLKRMSGEVDGELSLEERRRARSR